MIVKLLTEYHLEFLSLKGGCRRSSESTLVKKSNCWISHAAAHLRLHLCLPEPRVFSCFRYTKRRYAETKSFLVCSPLSSHTLNPDSSVSSEAFIAPGSCPTPPKSIVAISTIDKTVWYIWGTCETILK